VKLTHKEFFERYLYAGAISRNADAVAAMFTDDGVYEAPLVPEGHAMPQRLVGHDAIRDGIAAFHQSGDHSTVIFAESGYELHETADPDVFVTEIDTVLEDAEGRRTTMSLVQIFRLREGKIARLRDYFAG